MLGAEARDRLSRRHGTAAWVEQQKRGRRPGVARAQTEESPPPREPYPRRRFSSRSASVSALRCARSGFDVRRSARRCAQRSRAALSMARTVTIITPKYRWKRPYLASPRPLANPWAPQ